MIPEQLRDYPLIKVCRPNCQSHHDCTDQGKRPVSSVDADKPVSTITSWIQNGGNYGVVPRSDNDLVILDSDSEEFADLVRRDLPDTFAVRTGSGNYHFYYLSDFSGNETFRTDSGELGSIRTDNYQAVGPGSIHPDTGQEYTVAQDKPVVPIPPAQISDFATSIRSSVLNREDGGGGGGGGSSAGGGAASSRIQAEDLEVEPTEETLRALGFINSESKRQEIAKVIDHSHPPRQTRVWAGGFLYAVCGLTKKQIRRLLVDRAEWATDHKRVAIEVRSLIESSINSSGASESVDLDRYLGPGDMEGDTSESRKTEESGGSNRTLRGGVLQMVDDNISNHATVQNGSAVVRSGVVEVETDEDSWEYIGLLFGQIEEEDEDLGTVVNWEYNQYNQKNYNDLGNRSPEELRLAAEALEDLAEELE